MLIAAARTLSAIFAILYTFLAVGACALPVRPVDAVQIDVPLEAPDGFKRLSILSAKGEGAHGLLRAIDLYMEEHPEVRVSIETVEDESSYSSTLRSRLLAGECADLFHIFGHSDMRELEQHLEELSGLDWARGAVADTLEPVSVEERMYGIPYSIEGLGLIVNSGVFEAAEISIAQIESFEHLEEAFKALREKIVRGELREEYPELAAVTSLPGLDDDFLSRQLPDIALGGEFLTAAAAAQAISVSYSNEEGMGKYVDLLARYAANGQGWTGLVDIPRTEQVENGLAAGRVAVIQQSVEIYARLLALNPELEGKLRLLPIPIEGAEQGYVYTQAPAYWAINAAADEESKAIARDFLEWLYRGESGAEFFSGELGLLSPYREAFSDTGNALHKQLLGYIERGQSLPRRYREYPAGWAADSFAASLREYFTVPELSWEEVVRRNKQDWIHIRMG